MKKIIFLFCFSALFFSALLITSQTAVPTPPDTVLVNEAITAVTNTGQQILNSQPDIIPGLPNAVTGGLFTGVVWFFVHLFRRKKNKDKAQKTP